MTSICRQFKGKITMIREGLAERPAVVRACWHVLLPDDRPSHYDDALVWGISGGGSMAFDREDWKRRLHQAKTQAEFTALIMELPDSTNTEDQESSTTAPPRPTTPLFLNTKKGIIELG